MRREDRHVTDPIRVWEIIKSCKVLRLAMCDGAAPYIVPLSFGAEMQGNEIIFCFHCAGEGRKLDMLKKNPVAGFEMDTNHALIEAPTACAYGFAYSSVIGSVRVDMVEDVSEKRRLLSLIMKQQCGRALEVSEKQARAVSVCRARVLELCAKENPKPLICGLDDPKSLQ